MRSKCTRRHSSLPSLLLGLALVVGCAVVSGNNSSSGCGEEDGSGGEEGYLEEGEEEEEPGWWLSNLTNRTNYTELCTGKLDLNSSEPVYSYRENSTNSNCKCVVLCAVWAECSLAGCYHS